MQSPSALALTALICWTLFLLALMEGMRVRYLLGRVVSADALRPDNANLPPFMQRLARAHANCYESFPIIGGVLIVALLTGNTGITGITDGLAFILVGARVVQSTFHLFSAGLLFANLRFMAFAVQMGIVGYWLWQLLGL